MIGEFLAKSSNPALVFEKIVSSAMELDAVWTEMPLVLTNWFRFNFGQKLKGLGQR